ncbi:MAG: hypothetical protein GY954_16540 [Alteromonas sp.]|nr:hypothetical protein [Alteromonas sp.]
MEIEEKLTDLFDSTVEDFMMHAKGKEEDLQVSQISSSLLYSSACYSGKYFAIKSNAESVDIEEFIQEHREFFESSLRNAIKYYTVDE